MSVLFPLFLHSYLNLVNRGLKEQGKELNVYQLDTRLYIRMTQTTEKTTSTDNVLYIPSRSKYCSQQVHGELQIRSLGDALTGHCPVSNHHGRTTHQGERTGADVQNQQI